MSVFVGKGAERQNVRPGLWAWGTSSVIRRQTRAGGVDKDHEPDVGGA